MTVRRREWVWRFDIPAERLWPVLADTNRFNEIAGLPPYTLVETPLPDGRVRRTSTTKIAGMVLAWEERPYEWVHGRTFRQTRIFSAGPFRSFGPTLELVPDGDGTKLVYGLEWEPATLLGRLLGGTLAGKSGAAIERRVMEVADFLRGARPTMFDYTPPAPPQGAPERIAAAVQAIDASPYGHGLGRRLADWIGAAQEVDIARIRPRHVARALGVGEREAIETSLAAAKAGLLAMRWDLVCTNCRGAKLAVAGLDALPRGAHCPSCNIDYGREFDRNVELTFRPAPAIRPIAPGGFCLSGPGTTPHVLVQQLLAPGERRMVRLGLPAGAYRARTLHPGRAVEIDHSGGPFPGLRAVAGAVETAPPGAAGEIALANDSEVELALLVESRAWAAEALTASEATTLQAFRDLFAEATLRPGDEAGVGRLAILFTDLRGSTELYERIGDAAAYNLVREHFAALAAAVRERDGAVVKTIGDAVMAVFGDPADAVAASLEIQRRIAGIGAASGGLAIKVGVHEGSCIAVNLNDRLDYFGSAVNMAARLQGQSRGGDVVLSSEIAADPAVARLIAQTPATTESVSLKGFAEPVRFVRLRPAG